MERTFLIRLHTGAVPRRAKSRIRALWVCTMTHLDFPRISNSKSDRRSGLDKTLTPVPDIAPTVIFLLSSEAGTVSPFFYALLGSHV